MHRPSCRIWSRTAVSALGVLVTVLALPHSVHAAGTIFLDSCRPSGCTYIPGNDDSRTNHSSIINQISTVQPFTHGDAAWAEVVACVQREFAPYDVVVTDVDPGAANHFELAVAGVPQDVGQQSGVGGVSPFTCGVIQNGVAFSFANVFSDIHEICWTTAHEAAHLFGLDHELLERENMTYLSGCLDKLFTPVDAECGESQPRNCLCGGTLQNADQLVAAAVGRAGPGSPIFIDGFTEWNVADPANPVEAPSTCHWDDAVTVAPPPATVGRAHALRCGTIDRVRALGGVPARR
jgi:hypothetical protein